MTPTLIEAARAALAYMDSIGPTDMYQEEAEIAEALRAAIEAAEKAEPAAYRVECRWADPARDQAWRKYADYGTRKAAESSQREFASPGDIMARIVPLYAGTPEESR